MKTENTELNLHLKDSDQRLFEGWYFKVVDRKISLAVIVGISKTIEKSYAFIQTLDTYTNQSQMIEYSLDDFQWGKDPFFLRIKNNLFTKEQIILDIDKGLIDIKGNLKNGQYTKLDTTRYAPTIMGPFHYIPFLECNHGIISLHHHTTGNLTINGQRFQVDGIGYIEKDWGRSFPQDYLWLQSSSCKDKNASIFLSIAKIPLLSCSFQGIIMNLLVAGKQLRVATYYGARIKDSFTQEGYHYLIIKQHPYTFYFKIKPGNQFELKSPQLGKMNGYVEESLDALAVLLVYRKDKQIEKFNFINCGFELFGNWL